MAAATTAAVPFAPTQIAHALQGVTLHEPVSSSIQYAMDASRPGFDDTVKASSGVVLHVIAKLAEKADHPVAIRGSLGQLSWEKDHLAFKEKGKENVADFFHREFIVMIPANQANDVLHFKLVSETGTGNLWQAGDNVSVDLSKFGHHAQITIENVKFA